MKSGRTWRRPAIYVLVSIFVLYLLLLIPDRESPSPVAAAKTPFIWNQDVYWSSLEIAFKNARSRSPETLAGDIDSRFGDLDSLIYSINSTDSLGPESPVFSTVEQTVFELGPIIAAHPEKLPGMIRRFNNLRALVKEKSRYWAMNSPTARDCIYRLLYGGRAAIEEIMLQLPKDAVPALIQGTDEASITPSARVLGVTIHSGDILVSRGGAPTSALIARSNDYPGNFSHVALAYVDSISGRLSIIESHIERGATLSGLGDYLEDTKLRIMILRLRSDLPELISDPMIPHRAAKLIYERAATTHIAYDFEMDFLDHQKLFCSEVASAPYAELGINLWMGRSNISSRGVASWLAEFGVTHFETQEPSDLEYDPQLRVVAEWRDPETLFNDHVDNAVIDALLEAAEKGLKLKYEWYMLPVARLAKAYSLIANFLGMVGPVPEGMNASSALRNKWFSRRHGEIKKSVLLKAETFQRQQGYRPPYWELVRFARQSL